jgi:hypothetical protein
MVILLDYLCHAVLTKEQITTHSDLRCQNQAHIPNVYKNNYQI